MIFPYKLIDLTHTLDNNIPAWDNGCRFNHDLHLDYTDCKNDDKFRVMKIRMHAGIGTHIDAPSHCIPNRKCIHEFEVEELCMPCFIIDVSDKSHERYSVTPEDIVAFENIHGTVSQGSCVMIKTGWEKFWTEPEKYHNNHLFPSISVDAAHFLIKRGVAALGIDTLSPDRPENGFKVHQIFLSRGKILIENVANLKKMPPTNGYIMILPIKIKDGTGAPIRLIGLIKK